MRTLPFVVFLALSLVACGGSDSSSDTASSESSNETSTEQAASSDEVDQTVTLQPQGNEMKYKQTEFTVAPGETVRLVFENVASSPSMVHNVVIITSTEDAVFERVGEAGAQAGTNEDYGYACTDLGPHFAQVVPADIIDPIEVHKQENNDHPEARWDPENTGQTRTSDGVEVHMVSKRSQYFPDQIEAQEGDTVTIHLTNVEQVSDMIHGFGVAEHNMNVVVTPGETKTMECTVDETGVYPFYCTNFCSALHQEMQGDLEVQPS
ncbi:MAG: cupredoxin domain-containing protein [Salinibacter sp.]